MKKQVLGITLFSLMVSFANCKKSDNNNTTTPVTYTVPATYDFANVDISTQKKLIAMADQIGAAVNVANTSPATAVSAQKLKDMFNNVNNYFNDSALALNASGLKLSDYCAPTASTDLSNYFDSVGTLSQSAAVASHGVAGVAASSVTATKKYLLSATGEFYSQIIKKTVMAGICQYEISIVRMADKINTADNNTVVTGSGTAMEHAWDEAFGFFGVPVNFPASTTGLKYLASYSNQVDAGQHSNSTVMNALLKGRAAISAKDMTTKTAQAAIIITTLDKLDAAAIIQEMKETDANIVANDAVAAYGTLSETIGFIRNLKYNTSSTRIITDAQILQLEQLMDSTNPANPDLYNMLNFNTMSVAQMEAKTDAIRQFIAGVYGFNTTDVANM